MKAVAIITGPYTHLDHLGVLASILDIPLILTDRKTQAIAKNQYPMIETELIDLEHLSLPFLAQKYDMIFHSGRFWMAEMDFLFRTLFHKKMRFVYCPHGNSEKGSSLTEKKHHPKQDLVLHYGKQMQKLLEDNQAASSIDHFIRTGNYRYPFYLEHKEFFASLLPKLNPKNKTIFYAPTWPSLENSSSFFDHFSNFTKSIPPGWNLIVKLHPLLESTNPGLYWNMQKQTKNITIIDSFSPIYPLIDICDLYLGDLSSIGYDCLCLDKPLFFLRPKTQKNSAPLLYSCGMEVPPKNPFQWIEDHLEQNISEKKERRKEIYQFAFGKEISPTKLREQIFSILNQGRKDRNLQNFV